MLWKAKAGAKRCAGLRLYQALAAKGDNIFLRIKIVEA